jgi:hypothetical protein
MNEENSIRQVSVLRSLQLKTVNEKMLCHHLYYGTHQLLIKIPLNTCLAYDPGIFPFCEKNSLKTTCLAYDLAKSYEETNVNAVVDLGDIKMRERNKRNKKNQKLTMYK